MRERWRRLGQHSGLWSLGFLRNSVQKAREPGLLDDKHVLASAKETMNKHQKISNTVFTVAKWVSRGCAATTALMLMRALPCVAGVNALWGSKDQEEEKVAGSLDFPICVLWEELRVESKGVRYLPICLAVAKHPALAQRSRCHVITSVAALYGGGLAGGGLAFSFLVNQTDVVPR